MPVSVYDYGERTEKAGVLRLGFTNCPQQFEAVARAYGPAGCSVVAPRPPGRSTASDGEPPSDEARDA